MTVYKTNKNICRAFLLRGVLSWWVMAVTAITHSGADDRPGQPSAGGTPHSPFRSISVVNLSLSALYPFGGGCFFSLLRLLLPFSFKPFLIPLRFFMTSHLYLPIFFSSYSTFGQRLSFPHPTSLHISSIPPCFFVDIEAFPSSTYLFLMPCFY